MSGTLTLGEDVNRREKAAARAVTARRGRFHITSPRKTMAAISAYVVLALVAIFFIAPLIWLVLAAFEPAASIGSPTSLGPIVQQLRQGPELVDHVRAAPELVHIGRRALRS